MARDKKKEENIFHRERGRELSEKTCPASFARVGEEGRELKEKEEKEEERGGASLFQTLSRETREKETLFGSEREGEEERGREKSLSLSSSRKVSTSISSQPTFKLCGSTFSVS